MLILAILVDRHTVKTGDFGRYRCGVMLNMHLPACLYGGFGWVDVDPRVKAKVSTFLDRSAIVKC